MLPIVKRRLHAPDWVILSLACVAQFMVLLDVSIVNVALPSIKESLGFSDPSLQWVLNAYTLAFAGLLLLGGRIADIYGRRRIFLVGLAVFTAASLIGGFAPNQGVLLGARAVQGLAAGILSPATLTILTTTFTEPRARSRAMGLWSAVAGAGGAAGALLGGILTEELSWRWILFINVPIGIATMLAAVAFLSETRSSARQSLDVAGAALVTIGLTSLVFGLVRSSSVGWTSWQSDLAFGVAAVLIGWFLYHEARVAKAPLMPLRLFSLRTIWSSNLVMFLLSAALFAMWYFVSLYLQQVLGYSPLRTGFAFLPQSVAIIAGAQLSSRLLLRWGVRPLLFVGSVLAAGGLAWFGDLGVHTLYWTGFFTPSVLVALGLGLCYTPIAYAATAGVPKNEAGLASGLVNTARQIGGAVGLAGLTTLAASATGSALGNASRPSLEAVARAAAAGYREAFLVSALVAIGAALAVFFVPRARRSTPVEVEPADLDSEVAAEALVIGDA